MNANQSTKHLGCTVPAVRLDSNGSTLLNFYMVSYRVAMSTLPMIACCGGKDLITLQNNVVVSLAICKIIRTGVD